MTRFEHMKEILEAAVVGERVHAHGPFWRGLTRDEFVQKAIFSVPLISMGDGANSNLIDALRGELRLGRIREIQKRDFAECRLDDRRFPTGT